MAQPTIQINHDTTDSIEAPPPPLDQGVEPAARRSPAEEARTLVAASNIGGLATLTKDGAPWSSLVTYGALEDGSPVFMLSRLAEHGRNIDNDARVSLMVARNRPGPEPLAEGRVTLAGRCERAEGGFAMKAKQAHVAAVPSAAAYSGFGDFTLWVMRVERVRWVGGYGRMDSASGEAYADAESDPTAVGEKGAVGHLNADHPDALLAMAQALGGYPDATSATCTGIDRYGIELLVDTPRGPAPSRIAYAERAEVSEDLRGATVELARRSRRLLAGEEATAA